MKTLNPKANCPFERELNLNLWDRTEPKDNFPIKEAIRTTPLFNQTHSPLVSDTLWEYERTEASYSEENTILQTESGVSLLSDLDTWPGPTGLHDITCQQWIWFRYMLSVTGLQKTLKYRTRANPELKKRIKRDDWTLICTHIWLENQVTQAHKD